ncbi:MAG: ATP phosphoribosyltransferase [Bacilli bacterium]|nr:ATP phosphoribosyltransferase [Bacilli bacterium]
MNTITFALSKGRLAQEIIKMLETLGILSLEMEEQTRKLVFYSADKKYKIFLAKPTDVPIYIEYGIADIGVVGKDTIMEEKRSVTEVLDLKFGSCRLAVAGFSDAKKLLASKKNIRVATKYPNIAKEYFLKTKRYAEIIKLNGSVELGPLVGLSDVIVDIVESGKTLKENGLEVIEEIANVSARLIVNSASLKVKYEDINLIIEGLKGMIK